MSPTEAVDTPPRDPWDRRIAHRATGRLRELNDAGFLDAADIHVAVRLGELGPETDEAVLLAVAMAVRAVRAGSICIDLAAPGAPVSGVPWPGAEEWRSAVASSALARAGVLRLDGTLVYLARYWHEETQVVDDLRDRDRAPCPVLDRAQLDRALDAYFPDAASADQRAAAEVACLRWTSVVTGGPGTGKTTTIARLLGVLLTLEGDRPLRVAMVAPTGKAAARMGQALRAATERDDFPGSGVQGSEPSAGSPVDPPDAARTRERVRALDATTIHRLLGWRADSPTRFRHGRRNPLPYDVVVVDETSMVSLTLMARLLEAMRPEARLVLVGDADQLASVEAGAVLGDLVRGWQGHGPVRALQTTRRFGRNIRSLAEAIRGGAADQVLALLTAGLVEEREGDGAVSRAVPGPELDGLLRDRAVATWSAAVAGDGTEALRTFEAHRLLCAHRRGVYGVEHWNRHVERLLMQATGQDWLDEWYAGRPFIVNGNDRGLRLWNGDTGVAVRSPGVTATRQRVVGVVGGTAVEPRAMPPTRLADVSTAHAMTVHRSQGSQFDEVTVVLPEPGSRILTRELLYTAVTRARSRVRVVGTDEAIRAAVTREAVRATGLAGRLGGG